MAMFVRGGGVSSHDFRRESPPAATVAALAPGLLS
jgi:hypothetical protein